LRFGGRISSPVVHPLFIALAFVSVTLLGPARARAQYQAPSQKLVMSARSATTWSSGETDVALLEGPATVELDRATLTARQAVLWITPERGAAAAEGTRQVTVALIGDAKVEQKGMTRTGDRMIVTAQVQGKIQLRADARADRDASDTPLYRAASAMRTPAAAAAPAPAPQPGAVAIAPAAAAGAAAVGTAAPTAPGPQEVPPAPAPPTQPATEIAPYSGAPATEPTTLPWTFPTTSPATLPTTEPIPPTTQPVAIRAPVTFLAPELESVNTDEGKVAIVLNKGVMLRQQRPNGDLIELQAQRAVLFTPFKNLREAMEGGGAGKQGSTEVEGAYLEGDVRIVFTPNLTPNNDQRMTADRVYYDFTTDEAILTDAVMRQVVPKTAIPVTVRAKVIRQLAQGEFAAEHAQLSTSSFAVPSYAIKADKIYLRQEEPTPGDELTRFVYEADGVRFQAFDLPIFYVPSLSGSMTNQQTALRAFGFNHTNAFGTSGLTEWGLFETLGQIPPPDLDLSYRLDYYSDRGPASGLDGRYRGGFLTDTAKEPFNFEGEFHSYFVYDHGTDDIGRPVPEQDPDHDRFRGHIFYEHQHYFPDDWQLQFRTGWVSDQKFLEQWFPRQFDEGQPHDTAFYLKHQRDTEAFTLLAQFQPNDLVTTSDLLQEQFEVEHLPELGYRRIGDSILQDKGTFFSDNTVSALHFQRTHASLKQQGFFPPTISPGLPSLGTTGVTDDTTIRGDFRQEADFPFQAGHFKVVPYLVGRYTYYSDSPTGGTQNRLFAAAGARVTTAFWKTDDTVESEMFDLHRLRHVIEPELNLFTSAQTVDRSDVFIYDEQIDPVNDLSAVQLALHQRWQTYRGGPGRWRSVDFLTVNVEGNFFNNRPAKEFLQPVGFRGLFFPSLPETSVPRDSINADATWRISDNMALLGDVSENLDGHTRLATASLGLVARRDERMTYYVGNRYIADLGSNITTAAIEYQISPKYSIVLAQSYDFGLGQDVASEVEVTRRFDAFTVVVKAVHDESTDQNGFGFNIFPNGVGYGLDSGALQNTLTNRR
jgi:lipopolysaccharide export system protein LptA